MRILATLCLLVVVWLPNGSSATEPRECPAIARDLATSQLTWHEAGVDALNDAWAIHAALGGLAELQGWTWERAACAYSGRALRGETARSWISELDGLGAAPPSWPARLSWDRQGPLFERLLEHAGAVVRDEVEPVCDEVPTDWGGPEVDAERIRRGVARGYWHVVACRDVREVYLRRTAADR